MFTGLVTAIGQVQAARPTAGGLTLRIEAPWADLAPGESVAVNGACLTVERPGSGWFEVQVVATTLARTTAGEWPAGTRVNLERALAVGDRMGGHWVQGHVDGVGTVQRLDWNGEARVVDVRVPAEVEAVSVPLGSITLDGVSLTVNHLPAPGIVQVALIPHTREVTTLGNLVEGQRVQLEGDLIGKYVRRFTAPHQGDAGQPARAEP